jgi:hypothetical protein
MHCIYAISSSVAYPTLQYFSTLYHTWHDFQKKFLNIKCVFSFCQQPHLKHLILNGIQCGMIKNVYWSLCKLPIMLFKTSMKPEFLDTFSKNIWISNFMKICSVGAKLFNVDGQDRQIYEKLMAFCNFANAPKIWMKSMHIFCHIKYTAYRRRHPT